MLLSFVHSLDFSMPQERRVGLNSWDYANIARDTRITGKAHIQNSNLDFKPAH
jgi:hypothetical protein